jgi:hypothetical protein
MTMPISMVLRRLGRIVFGGSRHDLEATTLTLSVGRVRCALEGRQAGLRPCRHEAGTALGVSSAQRRSVRVQYAGGLVLVDLPVDVVVVLEQQE